MIEIKDVEHVAKLARLELTEEEKVKFSKQLGYKMGIDDYIVKPFDVDELVLKMGAILRRANISNAQKLSVRNLTLDKIEYTAYVNEKEISLTSLLFSQSSKLCEFPLLDFSNSS